MDTLLEALETEESGKPLVRGWRLIVGYAGFFLLLIGVVILLPLFTLIFYPRESRYVLDFLIPGLTCVAVGAVPFFAFIYKRKHAQLATHQDAFIVVLCWLIAIVACSIPFATSGLMNFHQAFFESASGITTTGLTVVTDFENFPRIFFILRSMTHLVGGIGLVLVMISALSDRYGMKLYSSEGHYDRFMPNLLKSSRAILLIYLGFIFAGFIGYICCGMSAFDALNHSISAVATGGFSTHAESIGYFNSFAVECVSVVLMLCGSTNFLAHVFLFKGKLKNFFCYCENKAMYLLLAILIPTASMGLYYASASNLSNSFRLGTFQVISALSSTGFQTMNFVVEGVGRTPSAIFIILALCMIIGGQTNSTSGGFKIYRLNLVVKSFFIKIRDSLLKTKTVHYYRICQLDEETNVTQDMIYENNLYVAAYMFIYFIAVVVFCLFGYPVTQSVFEVASIIGTSGLSSGAINLGTPVFLYYFSSLVMLLGRLEIFVVFYGFVYAIRTPLACFGEFRARRKEM